MPLMSFPHVLSGNPFHKDVLFTEEKDKHNGYDGFLTVMNALAVFMRKRFERRW